MFDKLDVNTYDYTIGGKMVVGKVTLDPSFSELMLSDAEARKLLKTRLCQELAGYMLENNLVEFTKMEDLSTLRSTVYVRAYLAPNDEVKILRTVRQL
jgi:hypothetical protein